MRSPARGVISSGPALHRGQCRSLSPSIVTSYELKRQITVLYNTVLREIFWVRPRALFKARCTTIEIPPDGGELFRLEFHPQKVTGPRGSHGCRSSYRRPAHKLAVSRWPTKDGLLSSPFTGDKRQELPTRFFWAVFLARGTRANGIGPKTAHNPPRWCHGGSEE
jgi:hypothetical protein